MSSIVVGWRSLLSLVVAPKLCARAVAGARGTLQGGMKLLGGNAGSYLQRTVVRTYSPKPSEIHRVWRVVDADGLVLGRLCTEVARVLRGKHRPIFAPHLDTGDHVIVVNAAKVVMTAGKSLRAFSYRHSGYPGGLRATSYEHQLATRPTRSSGEP